MFHALAAYIGSLQQSHSLISSILEHPPASSSLLPGCISALSEAAGRPEWLSLQDVDVPLHQRALSRSIDLASYEALLDSAPDSRSKALTLSCSIPHAGDWLNVVPSSALGLHLFDREFSIGLVSRSSMRGHTAPSAILMLIPLVTVMWAVGVMVTEFFAMTPSVMQCFQQLSLPH